MEDIISGTYFADESGKIMIVKLQGYIDQTNSYSLQKVFNDIINSGCSNVIIDFTEVMYISSAGWGIFVGEIKHFRDEGGDIKLANMSPDIYEVYQMLEFYHIFEDFNSIESAKNSFSEVSIINEEISAESNVSNQTIQIELEEKEIEAENEDNVMEISTAKKEEFEYSSHTNSGVETEPENIEITLEENVESEVEPVITDVSETSEPVIDKKSKTESSPTIDLSRLPLHEKIKKLVSEYPLLSVWQIKKLLKDKRFGTVKINVVKLYKLLKELDLETKIKRYRYYRSV